MRAKHVWTYVPLPAYTKLFWERVTFSRLTTVYLAFSILHFLVQLALQIRAFTINAAAFNAATSMIGQGTVRIKGLPFYQDSILRICEWVPSNLSLDDGFCEVIWPRDGTSSQQDNISSTPSIAPSTVRLEQTVTPSLSTEILKQPQPPIPSSLFFAPASTVIAVETVTPTVAVAPGSRVSTLPVGGIPAPGSSEQRASELSSTQVPALPVTAPRAPATLTVSRALPTVSIPRVPPTVTVVVIPPAPTSFASPIVATPIPTALNNAGATVLELPHDGNDEDDENEDDGNNDNDDDNEGTEPIFSRRDDSPDNQGTGIPPFCREALSYPLSILGNTKREDIVFIAFQFWVFGMSVVALLNESIPHIFASLVTHIMATAWGGFQLVHTANFRSDFNTLITRGACQGVPLPIASSYWEARKAAEIPSLALNILALLISCFLTWKLIKLFGWQTFKRVGASLVINRMYKLVLILSITIQLSLFFMAITVSLWLDRLINSLIGDLADLRRVYIATSAITLILLVPWLMIGWFGVRRELRVPMLIFLGLCILYLGGWGMMFVSTTFRWTFVTWRFFSVMAFASVLLTVASLILGLLCRMNFGRGLLRYLSAQETLPGNDFGIVTPEHDMEKVAFPSTEKPMPTFDAAYGSEVPAGGRTFISNGPRFFNHSSAPMGIVIPSRALIRTPSDGSAHSHSSEKTTSSWDSYYTYTHSRDNSLQHGQPKRWVIE